MTRPLTVTVDADSCPAPVRRILQRSALRRGFAIEFLVNRPREFGDGVVATVVEGETVDDAILSRVAADQEALRADGDADRGAGVAGGVHVDGDRTESPAAIARIVVTRDIPLAERIVALGGTAINDRGEVFDAATIAERRSLRDAAAEIRAMGLETMSRRSTFGPRETKAFADALDRLLTMHDL
jgi:uncharacterized protein YaiI (UPF0178 family)